jgi:hypothetical protein
MYTLALQYVHRRTVSAATDIGLPGCVDVADAAA